MVVLAGAGEHLVELRRRGFCDLFAELEEPPAVLSLNRLEQLRHCLLVQRGNLDPLGTFQPFLHGLCRFQIAQSADLLGLFAQLRNVSRVHVDRVSGEL